MNSAGAKIFRAKTNSFLALPNALGGCLMAQLIGDAVTYGFRLRIAA